MKFTRGQRVGSGEAIPMTWKDIYMGRWGHAMQNFFYHCDKMLEINNFKKGKFALLWGFRGFSLWGQLLLVLW